MCRKQSEVYRYKPLGVLKRNMVTQPTYGDANMHITTTGVLHRNTTWLLVYRSPYRMTQSVSPLCCLNVLKCYSGNINTF